MDSGLNVPMRRATSLRDVVRLLLDSDEPSIRWKTRAHVLGDDPDSPALRTLQREIRASARVRQLLAGPGAGHERRTLRAYAKWQGSHWVLATLADVGYPAGDAALHAMRDHVLATWLDDGFYREFTATRRADASRKAGVPVMQGRYRRCASQQGNALFYLTRLGLADDRSERLVERLLHWQWPDGGWNCDKNPSADTSSFMETMLPMCGLALHAHATGDARARAAAERAAEVFLERRLFKRRSDGHVIRPEFLELHYPLYWHYDVLGGLKAMAVVGRIRDPRCSDALDLLEGKQLASGGWPAEKKYYRVAGRAEPGADHVDWGGTSKTRLNPWVTVDALAVLRAADRLVL